MRDVLNRLGTAGLALIVGALVFGAILGAAATHRADQIATQNAAAHQNQDNQDQKGNAQTEQGNAQTEQDKTDKQDSKSTKKTQKAPTKKKSTPAPDHD